MSKIFAGMIFIFINFHINVGSVRVGLIPNFIGYIFILLGLMQLEGFSPRFTKVKPLAAIMIMYSLVTYVLDLIGVSYSAGLLLGIILGVVYMGVSLYISYNIVTAVKEIEEAEAQNLNSESLFNAWILSVLFGALTLIIFLVPLLGIFVLVVAFVFAINYLVKFYRTKNLFNEIQWDKINFEEVN